ncbi:hypothetical protein NQU55_32810 [Streptomyces sp. AA8]|uniref:Glycosyltransferase n=1 Tax=Streptomyces telluris TaxID=2720021 RepID=A0A9X2LP87_9ACTN|nr:hypothetical protein [Streptomyces telluris]MCQ8774506.1 hypothetical protein [Streptomyces telluris]
MNSSSPNSRRADRRRFTACTQELGPGIADAAAAGADLLLLSTTTAPLGWHVAESLGIPSIGVYLQPVTPTGAFGPVVGGGRSLGRWGNRAAGRVSPSPPADQPFRAGRIASLGAGTAPVPYKELTARPAEAVKRAVDEPQYRKRAAATARRMEAEDGAARVVKEIGRLPGMA